MSCPDCEREMVIVALGTSPPVRLDACSSCGGVWTDQSEANFIQKSDLAALPHTTQTVTPTSRLCPKDQTPLTRFFAESIPEHVAIYQCETCGGNWFPAGNLQKFKKAQSAKLSFFKTWRIPLTSAYAILLPVLLLFIITGGLFITVRSIQEEQQIESQASGLIGKPVVRSISPTEVFISFTTQKPVTSSISYWITSVDKKTIPISSTPQTTNIARLSNLSKDAHYFYQITLGTVTTEVFTFNTNGE